MKTRVFLTAALLGVVAIAAAPAQQPSTAPAKVTQAAPADPFAQKAKGTTDAQAEEVEIMRRLLERALAAQERKFTAPLVKAAAFDPNGTAHWKAAAFDPNGTWLDLGYPIATTNMNSYQYIPPGQVGNGVVYSPYKLVWDNRTDKLLSTWVTLANTTTNPHHPILEASSPQGVYLKGYGVVYTATVPLPPAASADATKPAAKPLTDWERELRELRGEKVEATKPVAPREALTDAMLRVLADNGKHFSQLAETEQLTIVLTLPRGQSCTQCHGKASPQKSGMVPRMGNSSSGTGSSSNSSTGSFSRPTSKEERAELEFKEKVVALKKDAQKAALLGDLHMKQAKNEQAAASFEEALKLYLNASESLRRFGLDVKGTPETDAGVEQELVVTAAKLLQVYTALGKTEEVKKTLKILEQHTQKTAPVEKTTKPAAAPKVELPAKLVISAPKKLLDLYGSGKLTFEEFRKNATIEYRPARTIGKP